MPMSRHRVDGLQGGPNQSAEVGQMRVPQSNVGGFVIRLTPTTEEDLEFVLSTEGNPNNAQYIIPWNHAQHLAAINDPDLLHYCIRLNETRVGFVLLAGIDSGHRSIEFRRIVVSEQGQGIGRAALQLVKALAFSRLNAHRLWLDVKQHNHRARALYKSEGFFEEGILRDCLIGPNGFESLVVMSILASEYSASQPNTRAERML